MQTVKHYAIYHPTISGRDKGFIKKLARMPELNNTPYGIATARVPMPDGTGENNIALALYPSPHLALHHLAVGLQLPCVNPDQLRCPMHLFAKSVTLIAEQPVPLYFVELDENGQFIRQYALPDAISISSLNLPKAENFHPSMSQFKISFPIGGELGMYLGIDQRHEYALVDSQHTINFNSEDSARDNATELATYMFENNLSHLIRDTCIIATDFAGTKKEMIPLEEFLGQYLTLAILNVKTQRAA